MDVYDAASNRLLDSKLVETADRLMKSRKEKKLWEVIADCVEAWKSLHPKEWQSYIVHLKDVKKSRKSSLAHSKDKERYLRYVVDVPSAIIQMIRTLYDDDELKMDKDFWVKFGTKFKEFKVPEKY
jgi:hypothetical protein